MDTGKISNPVTVKIGNQELEVTEDFIRAYGRVKDFADTWRNTFSQLSGVLIEIGTLQNGLDVDYKKFVILLGSLRDIQSDLDSMVRARVVVDGCEVKDFKEEGGVL